MRGAAVRRGGTRYAASLLDRGGGERALIERVTHPGRIAQVEPAVGAGPQGLGHHEIPPLERPFRWVVGVLEEWGIDEPRDQVRVDRKSTRLNSRHPSISYAVFCLKKKTK